MASLTIDGREVDLRTDAGREVAELLDRLDEAVDRLSPVVDVDGATGGALDQLGEH